MRMRRPTFSWLHLRPSASAFSNSACICANRPPYVEKPWMKAAKTCRCASSDRLAAMPASRSLGSIMPGHAARSAHRSRSVSMDSSSWSNLGGRDVTLGNTCGPGGGGCARCRGMKTPPNTTRATGGRHARTSRKPGSCCACTETGAALLAGRDADASSCEACVVMALWVSAVAWANTRVSLCSARLASRFLHARSRCVCALRQSTSRTPCSSPTSPPLHSQQERLARLRRHGCWPRGGGQDGRGHPLRLAGRRPLRGREPLSIDATVRVLWTACALCCFGPRRGEADSART